MSFTWFLRGIPNPRGHLPAKNGTISGHLPLIKNKKNSLTPAIALMSSGQMWNFIQILKKPLTVLLNVMFSRLLPRQIPRGISIIYNIF